MSIPNLFLFYQRAREALKYVIFNLNSEKPDPFYSFLRYGIHQVRIHTIGIHAGCWPSPSTQSEIRIPHIIYYIRIDRPERSNLLKNHIICQHPI
jgi:hypothetical protein